MALQLPNTQHAADAQIEAQPSIGWNTESIVPQQSEQSCPTCGGQGNPRANGTLTPSFVYALGNIEPSFPTIGVQKEFAQAIARHGATGLTDRQAFHDVLKSNRYLARQLCWSFSIRGVPTYLLQPRDPFDLELLVESVRREPRERDLDVVIGVRGPIAPPEMCNGMMLPIVLFDQLYSFDHRSFLQAIPRPEGVSEEQFHATADEVFDRIVQLSDNAGSTDEHRALNYLAVRYDKIYAIAYDAFSRNYSLAGVEVRPSRLSGTRKIVDPIFTFTHRQTDVSERYFARADVTEMNVFLHTGISHYYDR